MRIKLLISTALLFAVTPAYARSIPQKESTPTSGVFNARSMLVGGYNPSAAEWTNAFAMKPDALGFIPLAPANNLSDVANSAAARANLGLGALAILNTLNLGTSARGTLNAAQLPALMGDCATTAGSLSIACTKTGGVAFGALATQSTVNLSTQAAGTLQASQEPAHTGDVTNTAGSLSMTISAGAVTSGKMASGGAASNIGTGGVTSSMLATGAAAGNLDFTPLAPANNFSDVSSSTTARTNLGLGALATVTPGTGVASALAQATNGSGGAVVAVPCTGTADDSLFQAAYSGTAKKVWIYGTCALTTSFTIPNGVALEVAPGAQISVASGQTLTILGAIDPTISTQIFTGAGTVLGPSFVRPEWFGASTSLSDNAPAINKAIAAVQGAVGADGSEFAMQFGCGIYKFGSTLTFNPTAALPWRVRGCGSVMNIPKANTNLQANATFTGGNAILVAAVAGATTYDFTLSDFAVVNQTAGSGATAGLGLGNGINDQGGFARKKIENVVVSGFTYDFDIQDMRMLTFRRVSGWSTDSVGNETVGSVPFIITVSAVGDFAGDMDFFESQAVAPIGAASVTASQSGTTLTVSAVASGKLLVGQTIVSSGSLETISSFGTGAGGVGTYTVSVSQKLSSQRMLGASPSGIGVFLWNPTASAGIAGIRFHGFDFYGGSAQLSMNAHVAGAAIADIWVDAGSQFEGPMPGTAIAIMAGATGSGATIRDIHIEHPYMSGSGFDNHVKGSVSTGGALVNWWIDGAFMPNPAVGYSAIDIRGTGGSASAIHIVNNQVRDAGTSTTAAIYLENVSQAVVNNNALVGTAARNCFIQFGGSVSANWITAVGNESGGGATTSVCNGTSATHSNIGNNE
jgi:hypothetical protein